MTITKQLRSSHSAASDRNNFFISNTLNSSQIYEKNQLLNCMKLTFLFLTISSKGVLTAIASAQRVLHHGKQYKN